MCPSVCISFKPTHARTRKRTHNAHTRTGNLPINVGLTPEALKQFVNTVMQQMFLTVKPGKQVDERNAAAPAPHLHLHVHQQRKGGGGIARMRIYMHTNTKAHVQVAFSILGEPVIDSFVSGDGKFGFVEMRTIQVCDLSIRLFVYLFSAMPRSSCVRCA